MKREGERERGWGGESDKAVEKERAAIERVYTRHRENARHKENCIRSQGHPTSRNLRWAGSRAWASCVLTDRDPLSSVLSAETYKLINCRGHGSRGLRAYWLWSGGGRIFVPLRVVSIVVERIRYRLIRRRENYCWGLCLFIRDVGG